MKERDQKILGCLVDTHIISAKPVSSTTIMRRSSLGVSSATVRNIVYQLDQDGFVFQPHTSAGRLPTDRGYRSYIDHYEGMDLAVILKKEITNYFAKSEHQTPQGMKDLADFLASHTASYVAIGNMQTGSVTQAGVTNVVQATSTPDEKMAIMEELSQVIDNVSDIVHRAAQKITDDPEVYIGTENPFLDAEHLSIIIGTTTLTSGQTGIVILVGPKRMTYRKNISILKQLNSSTAKQV